MIPLPAAPDMLAAPDMSVAPDILLRRICPSSVRRPGGYVIRRQKCPNLFMLWGFAIPSNQALASISMG